MGRNSGPSHERSPPVHHPHPRNSSGTCQVISCQGGLGTYLREVSLSNVQSSQGNLTVLVKLQSLNSINPTESFYQQTHVFLLRNLLCCLWAVEEWDSAPKRLGRGASPQQNRTKATHSRMGSCSVIFPDWLKIALSSSHFGYLSSVYWGLSSLHKIQLFFFFFAEYAIIYISITKHYLVGISLLINRDCFKNREKNVQVMLCKCRCSGPALPGKSLEGSGRRPWVTEATPWQLMRSLETNDVIWFHPMLIIGFLIHGYSLTQHLYIYYEQGTQN